MANQINLFIVGTCPNPEAYGASATLSAHIAAQYYEEGSQVPIRIPGTGPFTMTIKVDDVLVKTITDIPVCVDPNNENEYNVVTQIPCGVVSLVVVDSTPPPDGPLDVRATNAWTVVSPPFATLNGEVNPSGLDTTVAFEFGLDSTYGRVAEYGVINGFNTILCSKKLKSKKEGSDDPTDYLEPNTLYHYRIVASNSMGTTVGEDVTFTTPSYTAAPTAKTLPATDIS